jgi:hypothetical protein
LILHSEIIIALALDIHIVAALVIESRCVVAESATKSLLVKSSPTPKSSPTAPGLKMGGGGGQKERD